MFDQPPLIEGNGQRDAAERGEQEALGGDGERHQQRLPQQTGVGAQGRGDQARPWQHVRRNIE